jgi:hypothetical protein
MADGIGVTLAGLLPERLDEGEAKVKEALSKREDVGCLKLAWNLVGAEVEGAVRRALDCDALPVLAKAWAQAKAIAALADPSRKGQQIAYYLGDTEFVRELEPVVEVTIDPCPPLELHFAFVLTAHVRGVRLDIFDGHITGGAGGDADLAAQLKLSGVPLHKPQKTRKLALPGKFAFDPPGIRIPTEGVGLRG